jgi:hypothetical protein
VGARQEGMKGEPVHGCRHNNVPLLGACGVGGSGRKGS